MSPELYPARMTATRLGVGVNGGGFLFDVADTVLPFLKGVTGASGTLKLGWALSVPLGLPADLDLDLDLDFLASVSRLRVDAARFLCPLTAASTGGACGRGDAAAEATLPDLRRDMLRLDRRIMQGTSSPNPPSTRAILLRGKCHAKTSRDLGT